MNARDSRASIIFLSCAPHTFGQTSGRYSSIKIHCASVISMRMIRTVAVARSAAALPSLLLCILVILNVYSCGCRAARLSPGSELAMVPEGLVGMRQLLQEDRIQPVFVSTPRELESAILQGRLHVVITAHLDMTVLPLRDTSICLDGCSSPLPEIRETMTFRGNCSAPPTDIDLAVLTATPGAAALLPFTENQCLIMSHDDLFPTLSFRMWFDNLYLRAVAHNLPPDAATRDAQYIGLAGMAPLRWPLQGRGARYITRVTIQGDGLGPAMGIWADESVYAENCTFANLGGNGFSSTACAVCSAAVIAVNATVTVVNSTFFDPVPLNGSTYVRAWSNGRVVLSGCEFAPTPGLRWSPFYAYDGAAVYSADADVDIRTDPEGTTVAASPLAALETAPPTNSMETPQRDDPWFVNARNLLGVVLPLQPAYPAPEGPVARLAIPDAASATSAQAVPTEAAVIMERGGGGNHLPAGAIAAIVVVAAALILIVAVAAFCARRRRHRQRRIASKALSTGGSQAGPPNSASSDATGLAVGLMAGSLWDKGSIKSASAHEQSLRSVPSQAPASIGSASGVATVGSGPPAAGPQLFVGSGAASSVAASSGAMQPPQGGVEAQIAFLQSQLDAIGPNQVVLRMFRLLGASHRRQGGQAVVAFATGVHDKLGYAIKFFASRARFDAEHAMYANDTLKPHAPKVEAVYDPDQSPDALTDRFGRALPPCIVTERGESLTEWSRRAKPDVFQAIAVLAHAAVRLRDMHGSGYVHRDIKPSNIMLLPRENRWTVIDFGRAAPIGQDAPLAGSLEYMAPEIMHATAAHATSAAADPAMDAWAIGVVAFELLTGKKALTPAKSGADAVRAQLRGETLLPWEGDNLRSDVRRKLGIFREPVLGLLRRNPHERASMQAFCDTCNDLVTSSTTMVGHP
eukprot:jgi/Ulvmu1/12564/UM091_0005.1